MPISSPTLSFSQTFSIWCRKSKCFYPFCFTKSIETLIYSFHFPKKRKTHSCSNQYSNHTNMFMNKIQICVHVRQGNFICITHASNRAWGVGMQLLLKNNIAIQFMLYSLMFMTNKNLYKIWILNKIKTSSTQSEL